MSDEIAAGIDDGDVTGLTLRAGFSLCCRDDTLASSNDNVGIDSINCSFECGVRFVARAAPEPPVGLPVEFAC
ncbi:hypothetical protein M3C61_05520 [Dermacoccus abyssi]|uniref:hypothetical protein n=1 Tax=Dermacoccus TaxID=57495 RepID=UPI002107BA62|nr:hypothetical protein [Dermacoccus sp. PAMC28757]MCT1986484.1 hypothetical protein [Dermacoccus abyssi]